jgi:septation ring formation regulator EzrA
MGDKEYKLGTGELDSIRSLFEKSEGTEDSEGNITPIINKTKKRFEKISERLNEIETKLSNIDKRFEILSDLKIIIHNEQMYIRDARSLKWYKIHDTLDSESPPMSALSSKDIIDDTKLPSSALGILKTLKNE